MSTRTVREAVYRRTCDRCGVEVDVDASSVGVDPISDWVDVYVSPVRARPGEPPASVSRNLCGPCSDECGLRGRPPRSRASSTISVAMVSLADEILTDEKLYDHSDVHDHLDLGKRLAALVRSASTREGGVA